METPLQNRIYEFIRQYLEQHRYSPSLTEVARGIGISPKSISLISRHIHALVNANQLQFYKKGYRNIQLVRKSNPFVFPVKSEVSNALTTNGETIDLTALLTDDDHFLLQVKCDAMREEGILPGDYIICQQAQMTKEGDKVVALIDGSQTVLRRISYRIPERITLIPLHPGVKPKAYLTHRVKIQGIFKGLLRT